MVEHDRGDDLAVVLDWVQANLNQPFGVDHLARRANMSLRTFNRRFTATTGTAPHRWLITQRVGLAQRLLEETDLDVEQVAEQISTWSRSPSRPGSGLRRRCDSTSPASAGRRRRRTAAISARRDRCVRARPSSPSTFRVIESLVRASPEIVEDLGSGCHPHSLGHA